MKSVLAFAVAVLLAATVAAQDKLNETVEVRVANVDVVVIDRAGKPVHGLTKTDFEVYENGHQQPITNLYEVNGDSPAAELALSPDLRKRRVLIFLDNYSLDPARRGEVLRSIERFVTQQRHRDDEVALVAWNRSTKIITAFTSDPAILKQGLETMRATSNGTMSFERETERVRDECQRYYDEAAAGGSGGPAMTIEQAFTLSRGAIRAYSEEQYSISKGLLDALKVTTQTFGGLEGRKVLVFAGAHLPEAPAEDLFAWLGHLYSKQISGLSLLDLMGDVPRASAHMNLEEAATQASTADVALYFIDGGNPVNASRSAEVRNAETGSMGDFLAANSTADAFKRLAEVTGGAVVTRTMSFDIAFDTLTRDLNSYYSLGFKPESADDNGKPKRVTVKVRNPQYVARARTLYRTKSLDSDVTQHLIANLVHGGMHGDWAIEVETGEPQRDGNYFKVPIEISLAPTLTLLPSGSDVAGGYTVYVVTGKGDTMSKVIRSVQEVRMPADAEQEARKQPLTFSATLTVSPGENVLSVAVVDRVSNVVGYARTTVTAE